MIRLFCSILYYLINYAQTKCSLAVRNMFADLPACTCHLHIDLLIDIHTCIPAVKLPACPPVHLRVILFNGIQTCILAWPPAYLHVGLLTGMQTYISACQAAYLPVCLPTCSLARRPAYYVALKPACLPVLDNSCLRHQSVCPSCLSFNSISWSISACSTAYTCMYETIYLSV